MSFWKRTWRAHQRRALVKQAYIHLWFARNWHVRSANADDRNTMLRYDKYAAHHQKAYRALVRQIETLDRERGRL